MKPVKNFVFAAVLVFIMALSTSAGDIDHPGIAAPTPTPTPFNMTTSGETTPISTDSQQTTDGTADYLFLEALAALLSVY